MQTLLEDLKSEMTSPFPEDKVEIWKQSVNW